MVCQSIAVVPGAADPVMRSKRKPPLIVRPGAMAIESPAKSDRVDERQSESCGGSMKSQTRAGAPLISSPTRPENVDCAVADAPVRSTPARNRFLAAALVAARCVETRADHPDPIGADARC
jgi:hypothetical protein